VRHGRLGPFTMLAVLAAFSILAPRTVRGQVLYGSIVGQVSDTSGAAVPGATVTITNRDTGLTRTAVSNDTGAYSFTNVPAGQYDVKIALQSFKESVKTGVPVSVNEVSRVDARLEIGSLTDSVTVASELQLLQTDKADTHTEIKSAAITQLPLPQNRNYQSLINLVPGATPGGMQNSEVDTPGRALTTNVNGLDRNNNGTKTDGATNLNIWLPHHTMIVSPAETIDTVNISTSNFDAEQGMAGGAAITVITKSGTNDFKGSGFAFYNNEKLNAKPYFATEKGPASAHIDGATLGGPLRRNRLFFFGAWEGQYQTTPQQFFYNVPPPALRAGDFSRAFNEDGSLQVIYDPRTGNPDGSGRQPFPNNTIPDNRINAIARRIQQLYPMPNESGSTSGGNVGGAGIARNFVRSMPRKFDRNNYDIKLNWNPSSQAQVWGKYSRMNANVKALTPYLGIDDRGNGDTTVNMYTFGTTWTLSPTMVLDATYAIARMDHETVAGDASLGNFGLDTLGIPGLNGGRNFSSDPRYAGIPTISPGGLWTGWDWIGNIDGWDPVQRDERTYALSTNLTKLEGAHELRFGYSLNRLRMDHWQPELGWGPRGVMETAENATALKGGNQTANLYNGYASFLLGLVSHAGTSVQYELMTTREWQHGGYVRDRWQLNSKLTFDLGLRYEYYPLMTRADRGIERIEGANDLASTRQLRSLDVLLGGLGGTPKDLGIKVSKTLFAPRLGAVYRLNDNTVFRTGYGITYNPLPFSRPLRGFYPLTLAADYYTPEPYGWVTTFEQGIPDISGPNLSVPRIPLPNEYLMRAPSADVSRSRIHSWNVAFERRLPYGIAVDLAYVGTAKNGGFADINANASDIPGGGAESQPFYNTLGRTNEVLLWGPITKSRYHSLQVAINRPFANGLMLKGAYTLSRAKNETDDDGWAGLMWNAPSLRSRNYALAGYDRPQMFQMAFVYELPYKSRGSGMKLSRALLGDWQINGIYSAMSGTPFTITASGADLNMPGNPQTADLNGSYKIVGKHGDDGVYFDPAPFSQPAGTALGNTGRNQFRGPGHWNIDFSLFRGFPFGGGDKRAELRVEFFNLANHPRWGNPDGNVNSGTFGRTYSVGDSARDFGSGERNIRLGLRFQF
jgi:outer membrane receptor protein involved in Fe transport